MGRAISYTLNLDANIKGIIEQAETARKALDNVLKSGNAPAGLEKVFGRLNELVASIKEKIKEPLTATSDFSSVESDVKKVLSLISGVIGSVHTLSESTKKEKISLLPPETQQQLANADAALKAYTKSLDEAKQASKELREAQGSLKKAQINREAAENIKKEKAFAVEETKKKIATPSAAEQALEARIKEAEQAQKELEEAQAALEKLNGTDKRKKEYRDAKKRVEGAQSKASTTATAAVPTQEEIKAIEEAKKAREEYTETLKLQEAELDKVTKEVERATLAEEKAQARVEAAQGRSDAENLKKKQEAYKALYNSAKELIPGFNDLGISMDYSEENSKKLTTALRNLENNALKSLDSELDDSTNAFENIANSARGAREEIREGTEEFKKMTDAASEQEAFKGKIKQFLGLSGAAQVMRAALRDAMQTITELDATMTEMAVVTDLGVSDYWNQLPQYTARANELGLAINDVYKADTLFYQQGLKTNEVVEISTETMKMARIAGLDTAEATDRMTAALRGFNMELNEASAQKVSDVYSELAAITAADVEEISSAMTKTASIASSAGMEFETTAAFLAQIVETTRESAETAGTAMKTVIARFQELKKDPSEIGEVDGEIVDANKIETALRSVGVALRDSSGQFRELDDVFLELSSKWSGLDKNTQRYIATIAAGSRQQSRFIAMMSDYGRTQELVTAANNSAGASAKQFEKTQESLSAKMEKLKNTWHEFTMGIMNSDLIKVGVDILTKFLEIINKATDGLGDKGFGGALMKIAGVFAIFKMGMKIFNKFETPIMSLFKKVTEWAGVEGFKAGKTYTEAAERGAQSAANNESGNENNNEEGDGNSNNENQSPKKPLKKRLTEITGIDNIKEGLNKKKNKRNEILTNKDQQATARREQANSKYTEALAKQAEAQKQGEEQYKKAIEETKRARQECEDAEREYQSRLGLTEDEQKQVTEAGKEGWAQVGKGIGQAGQALTGIGMGLSMIGGLLSSLGLETAGSVISDIGQGVVMLGGALMAIPPILSAIKAIMAAPPLGTILIILAAVAAIVATIVIVSNKLSLANRMKEAAEATEEAKEAAEEAKEVYDKLLSDKTKYDELQTALDKLTYGTKEWKQALVDANQQVLELLQTYPELAAYMGRGENGQLIIQDQGWDKIIEAQSKAVKNSQALVASRTMNEWALKQEAAEANFDKEALGYIVQSDSNGNVQYVENEKKSEALQKELKHYYLTQGKDLRDNNELASSLAKKYNTTTDALFQAQDALEENRKEIESIGQEIENVARAQLTALASEKVLNSKYGEQAIDTFSNSQNSQYYDDLVTKKANEIQQSDSDAESETNETFKQLAMEYKVTDEMTGDDEHDLEALYKAMTGVEDIPDKLEGNKEELRKAIAEIAVSNEQTQKMEDYVGRLEQLNSEQSNNIAGIFSQAGTGMSIEFAESFFTTNESGEQVFNQETLLAQAQQLGYKTLEEWAVALNKSVEDLTFEAEKNARTAIKARTESFNRLNSVLGKTDNEIQKIGETTKLSAGQEKALAEKLVQVSSVSGEEAANNVLGFLGEALDSVGDRAGDLSEYLGAMDWQNVAEWEKLPDIIKQLGITMTDEVNTFIEQDKIKPVLVALSHNSLYNSQQLYKELCGVNASIAV